MDIYQGDFGTVRILIVDDEPAMHQSYRQVFGGNRTGGSDAALGAMAAELFGDDDDAPTAPAEEPAAFDCDHHMQGLDAVAAVQDSIESGERFAVAFIGP